MGCCGSGGDGKKPRTTGAQPSRQRRYDAQRKDLPRVKSLTPSTEAADAGADERSHEPFGATEAEILQPAASPTGSHSQSASQHEDPPPPAAAEPSPAPRCGGTPSPPSAAHRSPTPSSEGDALASCLVDAPDLAAADASNGDMAGSSTGVSPVPDFAAALRMSQSLAGSGALAALDAGQCELVDAEPVGLADEAAEASPAAAEAASSAGVATGREASSPASPVCGAAEAAAETAGASPVLEAAAAVSSPAGEAEPAPTPSPDRSPQPAAADLPSRSVSPCAGPASTAAASSPSPSCAGPASTAAASSPPPPGRDLTSPAPVVERRAAAPRAAFSWPDLPSMTSIDQDGSLTAAPPPPPAAPLHLPTSQAPSDDAGASGTMASVSEQPLAGSGGRGAFPCCFRLSSGEIPVPLSPPFPTPHPQPAERAPRSSSAALPPLPPHAGSATITPLSEPVSPGRPHYGESRMSVLARSFASDSSCPMPLGAPPQPMAPPRQYQADQAGADARDARSSVPSVGADDAASGSGRHPVPSGCRRWAVSTRCIAAATPLEDEVSDDFQCGASESDRQEQLTMEREHLAAAAAVEREALHGACVPPPHSSALLAPHSPQPAQPPSSPSAPSPSAPVASAMNPPVPNRRATHRISAGVGPVMPWDDCRSDSSTSSRPRKHSQSPSPLRSPPPADGHSGSDTAPISDGGRESAPAAAPSSPSRNGLSTPAQVTASPSSAVRLPVAPGDVADLVSKSLPKVNLLDVAVVGDGLDAVCDALCRFGKDIEELRLGASVVGFARCSALIAAVSQQCPSLRALDLRGCRLQRPEAAAVVQLLRASKTLREVRLRDCSIRVEDAASLLRSAASGQITTLDVSDNQLCVKRLAGSVPLGSRSQLQALLLERCSINGDEIESVAVLARRLPSLRDLSLSGNYLGEKGSRSLVSVLLATPLRVLRAEGCGLDAKALTPLTRRPTTLVLTESVGDAAGLPAGSGRYRAVLCVHNNGAGFGGATDTSGSLADTGHSAEDSRVPAQSDGGTTATSVGHAESPPWRVARHSAGASKESVRRLARLAGLS
eukprot:TRINITY_DN1502_c1_g1_i3.p1 TRINITY_DN1502_c1_g1~~TRINITY_DN1502_c1_g1_i3.p1  ORF type:complete len:1064 (+),score=219.34 TRINITY_DN1502_c1_g1_i3:68-3259(+)